MRWALTRIALPIALAFTVVFIGAGIYILWEGSSGDPPAQRVSGPASDKPECYERTLACSEQWGSFRADLHGYEGRTGEVFVIAYQVCVTYTLQDFVEQYDAFKDPGDAAKQYATQTFEPEMQPAAEGGCLSGFRDKYLFS